MHISRKTEEKIIDKGSAEKEISDQSKDKRLDANVLDQKETSQLNKAPSIPADSSANLKTQTMEDVLRFENSSDNKNIQTFDDQNILDQRSRTGAFET